MVAYLFAEYAGSQPFIRWFVETLALIASIYLVWPICTIILP